MGSPTPLPRDRLSYRGTRSFATDALGRQDGGLVDEYKNREMPEIEGKTWFSIDGSLEPIAFEGASYFRFPEALARIVIERFSNQGDVVLDPFCGFGTTVAAAQAMGRTGLGIEKDEDRARLAASRITEPSRVLHASALDLEQLELPSADLIFTSPPYTSFREWSDEGFASYWDDFERIFLGLAALLKPSGRLVVEMSNVRDESGRVRPVAFEGTLRLVERFEFLGEVARCNTGGEQAGPGYDHSYLLFFRTLGQR